MAPESHQDGGARRPLLADSTSRGDNSDPASYGTGTGAGTDADAPGAEAETRDQGSGTFTRNLGALDAFAIIISIVIGSGIFTSPGSIDTNVPSPGVSLCIWLLGGFLAWTGASTMAELGTAIPGEGMFDSHEPVSTPSVHRQVLIL